MSRSFVFTVCAFGALTVLYRFVGDSTFWGECLTVWPPFVWCAVFAPRAAILASRRRGLELAGVTLAALVFLALTVEWRSVFRPSPPQAAASAGRLRIVSWNVAGAMPLDDIADLHPDIAFLQEIGSIDKKRLEAGPFAGYRWKGELDPGTLSRFPIDRLKTGRIGPWQEPQVLKAALPDGRALLLVNVRLMLPAFVVALASGEWPVRLPAMHEERAGQFTRLAALIGRTIDAERPAATILCGDFNTPGGIATLQPLRERLRDVWPEAGRGWGGTMTAALPVSRIDQCWVSSTLRGVSAEVRYGHSDHRMLVVDLAWR